MSAVDPAVLIMALDLAVLITGLDLTLLITALLLAVDLTVLITALDLALEQAPTRLECTPGRSAASTMEVLRSLTPSVASRASAGASTAVGASMAVAGSS
jgi:hypothetical protein